MIKAIITSLLIGSSQAGTPPPALLKQFMQEVVDNKLDEPALAQKYMCPSLSSRQGKKGDEVRTLFRMTVASYREELHKQRIDPQDLVIVPFDALAARPLEIEGDTRQVYVAQYKGKTFGRFLMQGDKIAALNLIHKGDKFAFFLSYCD